PADGVRTERETDERDQEQVGGRRRTAHAWQDEGRDRGRGGTERKGRGGGALHRGRAGSDPQARGERDREGEQERQPRVLREEHPGGQGQREEGTGGAESGDARGR